MLTESLRDASPPLHFGSRQTLVLGICLALFVAALAFFSVSRAGSSRETQLLEQRAKALSEQLVSIAQMKEIFGPSGLSGLLRNFVLFGEAPDLDRVNRAEDDLALLTAALDPQDFPAAMTQHFEALTQGIQHYRRVLSFVNDGGQPDASYAAHFAAYERDTAAALRALDSHVVDSLEQLQLRLQDARRQRLLQDVFYSVALGLLVLIAIALFFISVAAGQRQRATARLYQQVYRMIDQLPDAIIVGNPSGRIVHCNTAAEELFGYPRERLLTFHVEQLMPRTARSHHMEHIDQFFASEQGIRRPNGRQLTALLADGREIAIELGIARVEGPSGPLAIASVRDVTERETIRRELDLNQRLRPMSQIAGGIAHEFNNIMQVVGGCSHLLAASDVDRQTLAKTLEAEVDRSSKVIDNLAAFAKLTVQQPAFTDWHAPVSDARSLLGRHWEDAIEFSVSGPEYGQVYADRARLATALAEILKNAVAATRDQEARRVAVVAELKGLPHQLDYPTVLPAGCDCWVVYAISDTGLGMTQAQAARAFEPFFSDWQLGEGAGLGLSMVHGFSDQSGGVVSIQAAPGEGATVTLSLPGRQRPAPVADDERA